MHHYDLKCKCGHTKIAHRNKGKGACVDRGCCTGFEIESQPQIKVKPDEQKKGKKSKGTK